MPSSFLEVFIFPVFDNQNSCEIHALVVLQKTYFCIKDYEHSLALGVLLGQNQFSSSSIILLLVENQPLPKQNIKLVLHDPREKQTL